MTQYSCRAPSIPANRLSASAAGAVRCLRHDGEVHVAVQDGPDGELLAADGTLSGDVGLALGVPVTGDAFLTEGVTTGDGHRNPERVEANNAG